MKPETYNLYSRDFCIFLPNFIKIDPYNLELYRFKVGAFLRHSVVVYPYVNSGCQRVKNHGGDGVSQAAR